MGYSRYIRGLHLAVSSVFSQLYSMESGYTKSSLLFLSCLLRCSLQISDCLLLHCVKLYCLWIWVRPSVSQFENWRIFTLVLGEQGFFCHLQCLWQLVHPQSQQVSALLPLLLPWKFCLAAWQSSRSFLLNLILSTDQWNVLYWGRREWCGGSLFGVTICFCI